MLRGGCILLVSLDASRYWVRITHSELNPSETGSSLIVGGEEKRWKSTLLLLRSAS